MPPWPTTRTSSKRPSRPPMRRSRIAVAAPFSGAAAAAATGTPAIDGGDDGAGGAGATDGIDGMGGGTAAASRPGTWLRVLQVGQTTSRVVASTVMRRPQRQKKRVEIG